MNHELTLFRWAATIRRTWPITLTLAGLAIAIAALKGTYIDPKFPAITYTSCLWFGFVTITVIGVAWLLDLSGWWFERETVQRFRPAKRGELDELLNFYDQLIGGERPSLNDLKALHNANNEIFTVLEKRTKTASKTGIEIVGFCTLMPLTKAASILLGQEKLNGLKMDSTHICRPNQRAECLYVGSIGAKGTGPRGAILAYALGVMNECARKGVKTAFTRPVTREGLRVAKKYDF